VASRRSFLLKTTFQSSLRGKKLKCHPLFSQYLLQQK
jgi:hypothetical protein